MGKKGMTECKTVYKLGSDSQSYNVLHTVEKSFMIQDGNPLIYVGALSFLRGWQLVWALQVLVLTLHHRHFVKHPSALQIRIMLLKDPHNETLVRLKSGLPHQLNCSNTQHCHFVISFSGFMIGNFQCQVKTRGFSQPKADIEFRE